MPLFQECCVLIPATNLEDFPSHLSDSEATSLLAAWTVLWHPSLLAEMEQLPAWYRADAPPEILDNRLFTVPKPSQNQLPEGFGARASKNKNCHWLEAASRDEFLSQLPWDQLPKIKSESLTWSPRDLSVGDFFAAGYASLQVQIMTKRLRYTSNLDELHLQNCAVTAAKAFVAGDAKAASDSLHDLFDCLAEERDHYFSSDPQLIDLVLTGPTTIDRMEELLASVTKLSHRQSVSESVSQIESQSTADSRNTEPTAALNEENSSDDTMDGASLPTPLNLLVDVDSATALGELPVATLDHLKDLIATGAIGWAGGGPGADVCFDAMTFSNAQAALHHAHEKFISTLGKAPPVYGRFSGSTPADLTATLVQLGYQGLMPIDFEGGTGFGDEAKVILQAAGSQLEALTAKPIDASSDASFLTLGTRLGESIDRGEISTGLFAHWPGETCQGFEDLKRVASWSLCLGKFWKLDDYFVEGEHPYHHGESLMVSPHSSRLLTDRVSSGVDDPISNLASEFANAVGREQEALFAGMSSLVAGTSIASDPPESEAGDDESLLSPLKPAMGLAYAASQFAKALGAELDVEATDLSQGSNGSATAREILIVNPVSAGIRSEVSLAGRVGETPEHVYAVDHESGFTTATVDTPACGFARVIGSDRPSRAKGGLAKKLKASLLGGPKPLAERDRLQNEFMEVSLSPVTGAVMGVYSGTRGNRFSLRLVAPSRDKSVNIEMKTQTSRVVDATPRLGRIEVKGVLQRETKQGEQSSLADFRLEYTLRRGSRFLEVAGEVTPLVEFKGEPWGNYLGLRMAVASESAICRTIVRDKLHRVRSRRLVAPAGVVIDEAERQTLVCGYGLPFHRRVDDRFLDTLLLVDGESKQTFKVDYGIDVRSPVAACRSRFSGPVAVGLIPGSNAPEIGWICHVAPREVLISALNLYSTKEGKLAAVVRAVQTQSQTAKVKMRFCRDVAAVSLVDDTIENLLAMDSQTLNERAEKQASEVKFEGDLVQFGIHSHGVSDVLVVFD